MMKIPGSLRRALGRAVSACLVAAVTGTVGLDAITTSTVSSVSSSSTVTTTHDVEVSFAVPKQTDAVSTKRELQSTCAYGCDDLPCEPNCESAFAYCSYQEPLCFTNNTEQFANATVAWGWSNPIYCEGGSILCELWTGATDCDRSAGTSKLIGHVQIDTDANTVTYTLTEEQ